MIPLKNGKVIEFLMRAPTDFPAFKNAPKFTKFSDDVGDSSYFSTPVSVSVCLCRVSFRWYSPISLKLVENRTNAQVSAPIFWGTTPTLLWQIVSAIYCPQFGKVWLNSVCWSSSAKSGNELECRIYVGLVKWRSNFKPSVDQSLCCFETT